MRRLIAAMAVLLSAIPAAAQDGFARLEGHGGPVKGVAISADGKQALTASFDYSVGVWDVTAPETPRWLEGHEAAVNAAVFLPDGRRVLSVSDDFSLILWALDTGDVLRRFEGHQGKLIAVRVSPDGRSAASAGWDGKVGLWDLAGAPLVRWLDGHKANVNDVAFSTDGTTLYTASYDGTIRRWDLATDESRVLLRHGFGINNLVLNEADGWLAYGAVDGAVRAIDLTTEAEIADLTADRRPILALALAPDGSEIAVGDGEGHIMIVETESWTIRRDFRAAARGPIWALAYTPDGARLLAGGLDDAAVFWPVGAEAGGVELLASAERSFLNDPSTMTNGERQFARKCSICHTLSPDGARRAGPSLWRLFGRPAGSVADYPYSEALKTVEIVWEAETINQLFLDGPDHYTPGSKMPMQRIAGADDRRDLIDYLAHNTGPRADAAAEGETK